MSDDDSGRIDSQGSMSRLRIPPPISTVTMMKYLIFSEAMDNHTMLSSPDLPLKVDRADI
jgi:hypothetical protein